MRLDIIKSISKQKLPQTYAYALKSSQLEAVLQKNNIDIHVDLSFCMPRIMGFMLIVYYWLPNKHVSYPRLYFIVGALVKDDVVNAKIAMTNDVFPALTKWLTKLVALPENSHILLQKPYFEATYINGVIKITER